MNKLNADKTEFHIYGRAFKVTAIFTNDAKANAWLGKNIEHAVVGEVDGQIVCCLTLDEGTPLPAEALGVDPRDFALTEVRKLLNDWPTSRALTALGAAQATSNKLRARQLIDDALARMAGAL